MSGRPSHLPARPVYGTPQPGPSRQTHRPPSLPPPINYPSNPSSFHSNPYAPPWPAQGYPAPNLSGGYQPYHPAQGGPQYLAQQLFPSHAYAGYPAYPHPNSQPTNGMHTPYATTSGTFIQSEAGPSKRPRLDPPTLPARPPASADLSSSSHAWRNCSVAGCKFMGPGDKVVEHEGDRHLIFPNGRPVKRSEEEERYAKHKGPAPAIQGTGITLHTEEDIAKWIAERKAKWPSAKRQAEKQDQRDAAIARGENPDRGRGGKRGRGGRRGDAAALAEDWGRQEVDWEDRGGRGRARAGERGRGGRGRGEARGRGRGRGRGGHHAGAPAVPESGERSETVAAAAAVADPPPSGLAGLDDYDSASDSESEASSSSSSSSDSSDSSGSDDSSSVDLELQSGKTTAVDKPAQEEQPSRPLCRFFAKTGRCKHGDQCKFLHARPDREQASNKPPADQRKAPKVPPAKRANLFERPSMLAALLDVPIQITLSQLTQTIRFLVANNMLEGVEMQPGEAEERERQRNKIVELHGNNDEPSEGEVVPPADLPHPELGSEGLTPATALEEEA